VSKVFIHIGYPKTATTWLQDIFFPNITNFHFVSWREANRFILNSDCFAYNSKNVRNEFLRGGCNLLISSEFFATAINSGFNYGYFSYGISHKIKDSFPDATVIIFIRRQQSLIPSAYQQYVKNGGTYSFKRWLYSGEVFSFEHLIYSRLIEHYINLFGEKQVKVFLYEDFKRNNREFMENFCQQFGMQVDWDKIDFNPTNRGLRLLSLPLLKVVNHFYKKPVGRKRFICHIPGMTTVGRGVIKYLNPMPVFGRYLNEDDFLTKKDLEYIKNFYSQYNCELTKYFDRRVLEGYGYYL
jgi:hypothetical protein